QQAAPRQAGPGGGERELTPEEKQMGSWASRVLGSTEDVWTELFPKEYGKPYKEPKLVLFTGKTQSGCGFASAAVGPFYCPADEKLYVDLDFFEELHSKFKAPGDFAQAYVIAHEIGHHVQNLLGYTDQVHRMKGRIPDAEYNDLSVRLELQADFLAGVWAHHAQKKTQLLETGDIEEGLRAANAIGDDRLQMQAQGYVVPDSFTHGSSEQRVRWFRLGLATGDVNQGDTFKARQL
ncbi:MAG: metalloprotease, partial [Planctomycetaceae bacterium]